MSEKQNFLLEDIKVLHKLVKNLESTAKKGEYGDYTAEYPMPKLRLEGDLAQLVNKVHSMINLNRAGHYDE